MMNLFLCADHRYAIGLAVTIRSVLEHASEPCAIHVLQDGIDEAEQARLRASWDHPMCASVRFVPLQRELLVGFRPTMYIKSLMTYARFYVGDVLPDADRVLILDPDLLIGDDLAKLYHTDLGDHVVGAIQDIGVRAPDGPRVAAELSSRLGLKDGTRYFNGGVILIDMPKWRALNIRDRAVELALTRPEILHSMDQDVFNILLEGRWLWIDRYWNRSQYETPLGTPAGIVHLIGQCKPWHPDYDYIWRDTFFAWVAKTAYRDTHVDGPGTLAAWWSRLQRRIPTPAVVWSKIRRSRGGRVARLALVLVPLVGGAAALLQS